MRKHFWRRTTRPEKLARVEETMKIILCGGEMDDLRRYSQEQGWNVGDATLWHYKRLAYELMRRRSERNRDALLNRHLASRRLMLARAMEGGDLKTALDIERDVAKLQGLYPETTHKMVQQVNINTQQNTFAGFSVEEFKTLPPETMLSTLRGGLFNAPVPRQRIQP